VFDDEKRDYELIFELAGLLSLHVIFTELATALIGAPSGLHVRRIPAASGVPMFISQ
jgi:hypothetical protein